MSNLRVALWGPSGAGKSWLIYAFARELESLALADDRFSYELQDGNGVHVFTNLNQIPDPTEVIEDHIFTFRRFIRDRDDVVISDHEVVIHDNTGKNLLDVLSLTGGGNFQAEYTLSKSIATIALFDAAHEYFGNSYPDAGILSGDESYAKCIHELCELMIQQSSPGSQRYLAACISKIDFWPKLRRTPKDAFSMLFPRAFTELERYKNIINVEYFLLSSMGFLKQGEHIVSNYNPDTASVLDASRWLPYNVLCPFFWVFEEIERVSQSKKHYKYPNCKQYPITMSRYG